MSTGTVAVNSMWISIKDFGLDAKTAQGKDMERNLENDVGKGSGKEVIRSLAEDPAGGLAKDLTENSATDLVENQGKGFTRDSAKILGTDLKEVKEDFPTSSVGLI